MAMRVILATRNPFIHFLRVERFEAPPQILKPTVIPAAQPLLHPPTTRTSAITPDRTSATGSAQSSSTGDRPFLLTLEELETMISGMEADIDQSTAAGTTSSAPATQVSGNSASSSPPSSLPPLERLQSLLGSAQSAAEKARQHTERVQRVITTVSKGSKQMEGRLQECASNTIRFAFDKDGKSEVVAMPRTDDRAEMFLLRMLVRGLNEDDKALAGRG